MEDLLAKWDGESVSMHRDLQTGTWMFICIHSTRLGSAAGGTRMKHYPRMVDALADGMRLAEAMSLKFASVQFPHGGGKAVIALPTPEIPNGEARRRLLREYGAFINSLGGLYCGTCGGRIRRHGTRHCRRRATRDSRGVPARFRLRRPEPAQHPGAGRGRRGWAPDRPAHRG